MLVSPNFAGQQGTLKPAVFLRTGLVEALVSDHLLDHVSFGQQLAPIAVTTCVDPLLEGFWKWPCQTAILPTSKLAILNLPLTDSLLWLLRLNRGSSQSRTSGRRGSPLLGGCSIQMNVNSHGSRLSFCNVLIRSMRSRIKFALSTDLRLETLLPINELLLHWQISVSSKNIMSSLVLSH